MGDAEIPRRAFGPYEVESVLGRGAMGMVYLARDRRIGRKVALKTVQLEQKFDDDSESNEFFKRLQREAELGGSLQHPNIVTLFEPGYENNIIAWLATEYIDGESLRQKLRRSKPLPLEEALGIGEDVLRGLAYAHTKGIVHRDIKPANILLTAEGQAKLADFGIARPQDSTLTMAGSMLGTPSYMSPEQVRCLPVTTRSDLFGVGVVMYEMLTGIKPFAAADLSGILRNVVEHNPPLAGEINSAVPDSVSQFVTRLIAKSPDERFATASAAADELRRLRSEIAAAPRAEDAGVLTVSPFTDSITRNLSPVLGSVTPPTSTVPTITHYTFDDATPFIATPSSHLKTPSLLNRPMPAILFWAITVILAGSVAAAVAVINSRIDPRPTVTLAREQVAEFQAKKKALFEAQELFANGEFDESIARYEDYLRRYPGSVAAQQGRDEAMKALEASKKKSRSAVTVRSRKKEAAPTVDEKPKEPEKRPPWYKRIFGRGKPPAP